MKEDKPFSISARWRSFVFAFRGLLDFFKKEHNAWIHLFISIIVIILGFIMHISAGEWIAICFAIGFVWVTELINTAIEKIMDFISPAEDPRIKLIKDISAGAVLVAAIVTVIVGCIVFVPKI